MENNSFGVSRSCTLIVIITSAIISVLAITLNLVLQKDLFIKGVNFIYNYQRDQPYDAIKIIQNLIYQLCDIKSISMILLFEYVTVNRKLLMLVHISYFFVGIYFMALLRQVFQQSRPFWFDSRIENWNWSCLQTYGSPNDLTFSIFLFYEPIFADTLGFGTMYEGWIFLFVLAIIAPLSRIYLGINSTSQVLIALLFGLLFLVLYRYVFQKKLYKFFWNLFTKKKGNLRLVLMIAINILGMIFPIIFYIINLDQRPIPRNDISNMNKNCNTSLTWEEIEGNVLVTCHFGFFIFGMCYGLLLLSKTQTHKQYLLGKWEHNSCKAMALKTLIDILCCVLPMTGTIFIGKWLFKNTIMRFIFTCLGTVFGGFGLSYFATRLSIKWEIIIMNEESEGDYENDSL